MSKASVQQQLDLTGVQLDVYVSKDADGEWWNPEHGTVVTPEGWAFLPTGQAFVTRAVKAAGMFWLAWQPRSRSRQHRRLLGLVAPEATIKAAEQRAAAAEQRASVPWQPASVRWRPAAAHRAAEQRRVAWPPE